jgi:hypothetical protein
MGIRETLAALPQAGSTKAVEIAGVGTFHIKRLSMAEMISIPDDEGGLHIAHRTLMDEEGKPLYSSTDEIKGLVAALAKRLIDECQAVNSIDVEKALKN